MAEINKQDTKFGKIIVTMNPFFKKPLAMLNTLYALSCLIFIKLHRITLQQKKTER